MDMMKGKRKNIRQSQMLKRNDKREGIKEKWCYIVLGIVMSM